MRSATGCSLKSAEARISVGTPYQVAVASGYRAIGRLSLKRELTLGWGGGVAGQAEHPAQHATLTYVADHGAVRNQVAEPVV